MSGHDELVCVLMGFWELRRSMEGSEVEEPAVDMRFFGVKAPFEGIKLQAFPLFLFYAY